METITKSAATKVRGGLILAEPDKDELKQLDELKECIIKCDEGCRKAFAAHVGYAFLAGIALNKAKALVPHGGFIKWQEAALADVCRSAAGCYMRFADALLQYPAVGKCATVAHLESDRLKLTAGELPEADKQEVLKAVHDVADGRTLTQMYRDLGVIRDPRDPNANPKKAPRKVTAEELHRMYLLAADEAMMSVIGGIRSFQMATASLALVTPARWKEGLEAGLEFTALCREYLAKENVKRRKKGAAK